MAEIEIVLDYADSIYGGVVDLRLSKKMQQHAKKLLQKYPYASKCPSCVDVNNKDDLIVAVMVLMDGGLRKLILKTLHSIKTFPQVVQPININELAYFIDYPYSYVHGEVQLLADFGFVEIKREGKAKTIILKAKVIPDSEYTEEMINNPEKEVRRWKRDLRKSIRAENDFIMNHVSKKVERAVIQENEQAR